MEEGETVSILSRKELRKQKLMEYLATKGKLKLPNTKANLHVDFPVKKPVTSALTAVKGKENKVPVERFQLEATKVKSLAAHSTKDPVRTSAGVRNKENIKRSILDGQKNANCLSATRGPAQPNLSQNYVLRSTYTVISSKSNLNAATHVKNLPKTGMQSSTKASSNVGRTSIKPSNSKFTTSSHPAWSVPVNTANVRISLGPIVKTKTGLIPAVTQPRNTNSHLKYTSTTAPGTIATTTSVANKMISRPLSSVSVFQRKITTTVVNNAVNQGTTVSLTARSQKTADQIKSNSKPLLQISSALKSTSLSSKCKAAPNKPEKKVGISKTSQSACQHTDGSTKHRSESRGEKNDRLSKVTSQTAFRPSTRCNSRAVSGVRRGAVAELGDKTMKCNGTQSKKGHSSANVLPQQTGIKRIGIPVSKTGPQPARTISLTGKPTEIKTPKVLVRVIPETEGKKLTAAQEERMQKLQEWREAKGISYKRPPMPVKPEVRRIVAMPQPFWTAMKEEDEAHSLICAVDRSLADCIKLLGEGCPPDQVKEVLARLPAVSQKFAKYWICQARLMEQEGNLDVLPMFKEAVRVVLEPVDELRTVVFEILKKKDEIQASEEKDNYEHQMPAHDRTDGSSNNPMMTPKPVRALICGEKGDSSVVKYKITVTPGGPSSQQREPARVNGQEVRFFTPVRRSVRIERASFRYPASLQDHDLCVASYNDLICEEDKEKSQEQKGGETSPSVDDTPMYIYRQNEALKDKVSVHLVCNEGI